MKPLTRRELEDRLDESLLADGTRHLKRCRCVGDTHVVTTSNETVGLGIALQARTNADYDSVLAGAQERIG